MSSFAQLRIGSYGSMELTDGGPRRARPTLPVPAYFGWAKHARHRFPPPRGSRRRMSMEFVRVCVMGPDGELAAPREVPKTILSDAQWQRRLTAEQYQITWNGG